MENPASWDEVTKAIHQALVDFQKMMDAHICGPSNARFIRDELAKKGFLKEPKDG